MRGLWAAATASLVLTACATAPPPKPIASSNTPPPAHYPAPHPSPLSPTPPEPPPPAPRGVSPTEGAGLASLPGWAEEDHLAALGAFQAGCGAARDYAMRDACQKARLLVGADDRAARRFFEEHFRAETVGVGPGAEGMMTAYFAPEYEARDQADAEFSAPVRSKPGRVIEVAPPPPADPSDLIGAVLAEAEGPAAAPIPTRADLSYADRAAIERTSGDGALAWMRPEDLFFLQIQGSGTLAFPDGRRMKATYAGDNGKPFVAIARPMVNQKLLGASGASGEAIRAWLAAHRGPQAQAIMQLNPRYVFFALAPDDGREPAGAAGIPLPAGRAIAVDPGRHTYGEVFWIDASAPVLSGAFRTYRRLVVALDTGAAIRGDVRADLYIGRGAAAGTEAGRVRHSLRMTRLAPIAPESLSGSARRETGATTGGG